MGEEEVGAGVDHGEGGVVGGDDLVVRVVCSHQVLN